MYHVFLPALTLALIKAAFISRLTRTSLLEVLARTIVRTARAKGARERRVIYRHGLRNALLPVIDRARPQHPVDAVGIGRDRARLQPARARQHADQRHRRARLSGHPGRHRRVRALRRPRQPGHRPRSTSSSIRGSGANDRASRRSRRQPSRLLAGALRRSCAGHHRRDLATIVAAIVILARSSLVAIVRRSDRALRPARAEPSQRSTAAVGGALARHRPVRPRRARRASSTARAIR